eukprot:CAMPEP_0113416040 /NCGR_PEP_ID=MMETSP0013_2-20120614/24906_1 /TAXON_ID=2843 ORGANISM="Skeletonema costatum, Strain 1716" /NCGR_SAMPLE_ID=MMETSP0013_2 /ASSEMBLY_ACC=CAM_ASM_000158 /LENGTH=439 /DNA_ID=CAMNT_0000303073 /DNA_START=204 /DNA_END=1523 /DNA_ORIENTATION=+ /assembly_acc=CAM_ASM_000158
MVPRNANVVKISYNDLVAACSNDASSSSVDDLIEQAFGKANSSSLGIIAITDIPSLPSLRTKLLPLAPKLAALPPQQLEEITAPESQYQVGWSHGREKLEGDKLDFSKGSYYANPLTDDLVESMLQRRRYNAASQLGDGDNDNDESHVHGKQQMEELLKWDESLNQIQNEEELRQLASANPAFFAPNVWPTKSLPELENSLKEMGQLIHRVGVYLAKCCDSYVAARCPGYKPNTLESILLHSKCCKARLLHYFAKDDTSDSSNNNNNVDDGDNNNSGIADDTQFSSWCGWHNDHGSLTGLVPAMYHDENGNIVQCPDEDAGLYIKSRNGDLVGPVKLPENALAFQVGETMQVHTGGWLHATPHAVRGCKKGGISRSTFAVFMEPEYHSSMDLPAGRSVSDTQCEEAEKSLPKTVRTLRSRWKLGMNFGEFSEATFAAFH